MTNEQAKLLAEKVRKESGEHVALSWGYPWDNQPPSKGPYEVLFKFDYLHKEGGWKIVGTGNSWKEAFMDAGLNPSDFTDN